MQAKYRRRKKTVTCSFTKIRCHFGRDKTEALLRRKYWWPTLAKDTAEYVKTCLVY
ncbi:hypothetical protein M433DRAFT_9221 [Acidomyces richmondensis BFW]|nr:MAG: hypothetical protein FE78DRAFT_26476 [Acidomyces sp. 'richmondensis']KYG40131.1 hypothetical protein M433DRAFT_9221 [Acidomyces richmondensis BFW]